MIVRWGIEELPALAGQRPLVVASPRWRDVLDAADRWEEVPSHRIEVPDGVDTIVAIGGGSAIDTGKAASAASGLPLVSVPTTYSGAEWTSFYGVRDPGRRMRGGGAGANLHGIVYEPKLTLGLPIPETVGTSLNALAHCAEALYVRERTEESDRDALEGARLIGEWLPQVVERPDDLEARTGLLRGACHAGAALGGSMLALGHALAQALGGRYGAPHGALNALTLPAALRFNEPVAGRGDRALRRRARHRRPGRAGRGARPPRRLRAPPRPRHPRGRGGRGGRVRCSPPGREGEPARGHAGGRRSLDPLDLVSLCSCNTNPASPHRCVGCEACVTGSQAFEHRPARTVPHGIGGSRRHVLSK